MPSFVCCGPCIGVGDPDATGHVTLDQGMSHTLLNVSSTGECGLNGDCMSTFGSSIASARTGDVRKKSIVLCFPVAGLHVTMFVCIILACVMY